MNATTDLSNHLVSEGSVLITRKDEITTSIVAWGLSLFAASLGFPLGLALHTPRFNHEGIVAILGIFLSASPEAQLGSLLVAQTVSGVFASLALMVGFMMWGGMHAQWEWSGMGGVKCVQAFFGTLAAISMAGAAFLMYANPAYVWTDYAVIFYIAASFFLMLLHRKLGGRIREALI